MSLLDDFKKQHGTKVTNLGQLNRKIAARSQSRELEQQSMTDPLAGITVTAEYLKVKSLLESNYPLVFVSGKAGTGKSTLITYLRYSYKNNIVVVAPTGVAALNVAGATIHSYFKLPPRIVTVDDIKETSDRRLYARLDLLIVDEISMVRVDLIDAMDAFLRLNGRDENLPFGGTQILFVGDMFQLPPVVTRTEQELLEKAGYATPYFFSAKALEECEMASVELTEVFRQRDPEFANLLNQIRVAENLKKVLPQINEQCCHQESSDSLITLSCTNAVADQINLTKLNEIAGKSRIYLGEIEGRFAVEEDRLPSPLNLELKVGAQVMFTKNDGLRQWVNGTLGKIVDLSDTVIKVELISENTGSIVNVLQEEWESYRYEYNAQKDRIVPVIVGKYTQFPLMLAWAVTIHKSQGKTLEKVNVDLGTGAFAPGQVYVALSRCRSLQDVSLARPINPYEVKCDPKIQMFHEIISNDA